VTAESVVDQVDGDGHVDLGLHLPLDLLLAAAPALGAFLLVLSYVDVDAAAPLGYLLEHFVHLHVLGVRFCVLRRDKPDLVEAPDLHDLLEQSQERLQVPLAVQREVEVLEADLQVGAVYDEDVLQSFEI
jgi:hypothetical protein